MKPSNYVGIHPNGCGTRNPWKLIMPAGGKQKYAGVYPTVEDALEQYNNAAYYLTRCGRGLMIPLQGPREAQERYILPADLSDAAQYIPAATEQTLELLAWAEVTFAAADHNANFQGSMHLGMLPIVTTAKLSHIRLKLVALVAEVDAMQRLCDPEFAELEQEHKKILDYVGRVKGTHHEPLVQKHLEDFYVAHPEFRS